MTKTFTQDDIIRFIYDETDQQEKREIESALLCDGDLLDTYRKYLEIKKQLDLDLSVPPQRVIDNILNYSKSYYLHPIGK